MQRSRRIIKISNFLYLLCYKNMEHKRCNYDFHPFKDLDWIVLTPPPRKASMRIGPNVVPGTADWIGLYLLAEAATGSLYDNSSMTDKLLINNKNMAKGGGTLYNCMNMVKMM